MSKYSKKLVDSVIDLKNCGMTVTEISDMKRLTKNQVQYIVYQMKRDVKSKEPETKFKIEAIECDKESHNLYVDSFLQKLKKFLFG